MRTEFDDSESKFDSHADCNHTGFIVALRSEQSLWKNLVQKYYAEKFWLNFEADRESLQCDHQIVQYPVDGWLTTSGFEKGTRKTF